MDSPAYPAFLENLQPIVGSVEIIHASKLDVAGAIAKGNAGQKGGVMEVATFFDVEDVFLEVGGVLSLFIICCFHPNPNLNFDELKEE